MEKRFYDAPVFEAIRFDAKDDIVTASLGGTTPDDGDDESGGTGTKGSI